MNLKAMVVSKATQMPVKCWGSYKRCALVIVDRDALRPGDEEPRMISERARGVVSVVVEADRLHVGRADSGRCAWRSCEREYEAWVPALDEALRSTPDRLRAVAADVLAATTWGRTSDHVAADVARYLRTRRQDTARETGRVRAWCRGYDRTAAILEGAA